MSRRDLLPKVLKEAQVRAFLKVVCEVVPEEVKAVNLFFKVVGVVLKIVMLVKISVFGILQFMAIIPFLRGLFFLFQTIFFFCVSY